VENALESQLARAVLGSAHRSRTLCIDLEAPLVPAERLLAFPGYEEQLLWAPSPEEEHSGVGAAHVLLGSGPERFAQIGDQAARIFNDLVKLEPGSLGAPEPKLIGGFAFREARLPSSLWQGFADARFVLPRIAYTRRAGRAWLTLSVSTQELAHPAGRARLIRDAQLALQTLRLKLPGSPPKLGELRSIESPESEWDALVSGILDEIAAGRLEKAVLARATVLCGASLPPAAWVLERLRTEAPRCSRFALAVAGRTFLGASPERLVKRAGLRFWTEAMAGSMQNDAAGHVAALVRSTKEVLEHGIVAERIRTVLEPLHQSLSADGPDVHRLRHLSHLRTRFAGVLKGPMHVLDLVARLHPTPAVGGAPQEAALAWLAEHEQFERGFYAGPFGAFDSAGNGEFVVAIRSGLLAEGEAHLFAGAGIVEGSETHSELRETRLKLHGLLAALGVA
jgi:isochorismate synthase